MNEERMELGKKLDKALHYAAKNLYETGHNSKPVLFHSFKVSYLLYENGYNEKTVIGATLHDLIEDTEVSYEQLVNDFDKEVAEIVQAVSFDPKVDDKLLQVKLMFENCKKYGKEALLIKCSDLIDNIQYVQFVNDKEKRISLLKKYSLFIEIASDSIGDEKIFHLLQEKIELYK